MFILGNLFVAIGYVLRIVVIFFEFCIIMSALLSFFMPYYNKFRGFVDSVANVILNPIRRFIPIVIGPLDFSPMIGFLILIFLDRFLIQSLLDLGLRLGG
ncbi:MAG TPA: YggT family protein [Defluviitoga sp.]|nr:YggT family protein [Defluviitoga sp.]HOP24472.1 YggT family protein [Defluviitoga sp.]HPZ28691.1 YggT family protein [Defluviitoga sp.]HQD62693.1 YggT family protein [Defluviitoga sp.]